MQSRLTLCFPAVLTLLAAPVVAGAQTTYGAGVALKDATAFSDVQARPNTLEGQTIRVDGAISSVCSKPGCRWMAMIGSGGSDYGNTVFVRIDPEKIVFPKSAEGHRVSVQGVMQSVARDPDPQVKETAAEYGDENGGGPPLWVLKATGAIVQ
jgi:hypothetical protein